MNKWLLLPLAVLTSSSAAGAKTAVTPPTEHFGFELAPTEPIPPGISWSPITRGWAHSRTGCRPVPSGRARWGIHFSS